MATFEFAMSSMRNGDSVTRSAWVDSGRQFIRMDLGNPEVEGDPDCIVLKTNDATELSPWIPSGHDIMASDWDLVSD